MLITISRCPRACWHTNTSGIADKTQAFYNDQCRDRWYGPKICVLMFSLIKGHRHRGTFKRLTLRRRLSILRRGMFRHKRVVFGLSAAAQAKGQLFWFDIFSNRVLQIWGHLRNQRSFFHGFDYGHCAPPTTCNFLRSTPFRTKLNRVRGVIYMTYTISCIIMVKMQQLPDQTTVAMDAAIVV